MNWPAQCSDVYAQKRWKSSFSRKLQTVRRQFLAGRLGAAIVLAGSDNTLDQGRGPDRALRIFSNVLVTPRHAPSKLGEPYRSSPTFLSDVLLSSRSYSYFVVTLRRANRPSASCVAPTVSFHLPSASTTVTAGKADSSFSRQERTRSASGPGANSSSTQPLGSFSWLVCARDDSAAHRLTSTTTHNKPRTTLITASSPFPSEFEMSGLAVIKQAVGRLMKHRCRQSIIQSSYSNNYNLSFPRLRLRDRVQPPGHRRLDRPHSSQPHSSI